MDKTDKSTVNSERVELFQTLSKTEGGEFIAVLSDTSIDRDGEVVGKEALTKLRDDDDFLAILVDHKNSVESLVGEWTNKRVEQVGEHTALVATPKFFLSNPMAVRIKGMLEEGAKIGISIGAIIKDSKEEMIKGMKRRVFTSLELLEASFVAIPSNRHGAAMMVSKSFINKKSEGDHMDADKTYTEKEFQVEVDAHKEASVQVESLTKDLEKSKSDVEELQSQLEKAKTDAESELSKSVEEAKEAAEKTKKEMEDQVSEIAKLKELATKKTLDAGDGSEAAPEALAKGQLPIRRSL